jgi:hypothetical protein
MASVFDEIVEWCINHGDAELGLGSDEISDAEVKWRQTGLAGIYSSKPNSITSRLTSDCTDLGGLVIGAYGIPTGNRRQWLQDAAMSNTIWFLGDLDGADIMAYSSLADGAAPGAFRYLGIGDSLLAKFDVQLPSLQQYLIAATSTEVAAIDALNDMGMAVETIVGPICSSVLQSGKKVEIEGLLWEIKADELVRCVAA